MFTHCDILSVLPVLIPSNRDNTLNPDFGFGDGEMDDMLFTEKRAEIWNNSNIFALVW
jgi:hypothetical protein